MSKWLYISLMRVMMLAFWLVGIAAAEVVLDISRQVSFFEAPKIRVTGLQPLVPITIRITTTDAAGHAFSSQARFRPDLSGVVDTRSSVANGDYEGVDPLGPLWSAKGTGALMLPVSGSTPATIHVEDADGRQVAFGNIERVVLPSSVTVTNIRPPAAPFVANLYEHSGRKRPAAVTLTGSNGGIDRVVAPWLVSQGYNVLALGYFHGENLPENCIEIPLEYFGAALEWLARRPSVQGKIAVVGISKGAEAGLLIASHYADLVSLVAAFVPSHVVWEGIDARFRFGRDVRFSSPGKSSWSLKGTPLPFVRPLARATKRANAPLDAFAPALEATVDPAAVIPVERIRAPVFLVGAGDDLVWPSLRMAREIKNRLKQSGPRYVQLWEYPIAGHFFFPPGLPVNVELGGAPSLQAKASSEAWSRLCEFLRAHLGDNAP